MTKSLDVIGIGNAIVDILARTDDQFLIDHGMTKNAMMLIDAEQAEKIYADMGPAIESSGGSAANTIAGLASLGGRGGFIGKVRNDQLGEVFAHDTRAQGIAFPTAMATEGDPTARSMIFITPDHHRTMNTFLGAAQGLSPADIDPDFIRSAHIVYMEGYLWDPVEAKKAFVKAMDAAEGHGTKVSLTLSDSFCVDRYRDEFRDMLDRGRIDILFANEAELISLTQEADFDTAVAQARGKAEIIAVTRSEKGSLIVTAENLIDVPAEPTEVEDTTGAGDLYAGGFLFGYTQGYELADAARIGSIAAAEVISHIGPRPATDLKALTAQKLG